MIPQHNTGLIEGSGTLNPWIGGTIPFEVRLPSGDWRPYCPTGEKQKDPTETMACVSFSHNNNLEIQNKFLGVDVNYSDRFLAKMSGTTHDGNNLDKVADTSKNIGSVPESVWPDPSGLSWDQFYSDIPQSVINQAVKQPINYEWQNNDVVSLKKQLQQCPLQVTIPYPHPNHAVVLVHIEGTTAYYFDTYSPFLKTMDVSKIASVMKIVINQNNNMQLVKENGTIYLQVTPEIKFGIADPETLAMFGSAPILEGKTTGLETFTISKGFILNKK